MLTHCRIGRVRHKATGQEIRVIQRSELKGHAATLVERAACVAKWYPEEMGAFFVIGVGKDGSYSASYHVDDSFPLSGMMFMAYVNEAMRREIATSSEIEFFCKQQGWVS